MKDKFLSSSFVDGMTGLSDTTRWREEKAGRFPSRRQISPNRVGYLESEIFEWMESRPIVGRTFPNLKNSDFSSTDGISKGIENFECKS